MVSCCCLHKPADWTSSDSELFNIIYKHQVNEKNIVLDLLLLLSKAYVLIQEM